MRTAENVVEDAELSLRLSLGNVPRGRFERLALAVDIETARDDLTEATEALREAASRLRAAERPLRRCQRERGLPVLPEPPSRSRSSLIVGQRLATTNQPRHRAPRPSRINGALLDRPDVLIVDTETTAVRLRPKFVAVAEIDTTGARRFAALSLPESRISAQSARIHGLRRDVPRNADARPRPELHADFAQTLERAAAVLGWNAALTREY